MSNSPRRILIAHPHWGRGGAEIGAMLIIQTLTKHHDVYHITRSGWDLQELNKLAGTILKSNELKVIYPPFKKLFECSLGGAIWHALFLRYCRHIGKQYDICITASRTIGWGRPAVHFLSDVVWNDQLEQRLGENIPHKGVFQKVLFHMGRLIAGKARYELNPADVFVANSHWTAEQSAAYTTTTPIVIYPAVTTTFDFVPWEDRSNRFVSIGRISPEKRLEDTIAILEGVRERGFEVGLTIYGVFDQGSYSQFIFQLCQERDWIDTPGAIYGEHKMKALPVFKHGINTCGREAFGISTAEMMQAGIVPFVPDQGAQKELVQDNRLVFTNRQDAVDKIVNLLSDFEMQGACWRQLSKQKDRFSSSAYNTAVLELFSKL